MPKVSPIGVISFPHLFNPKPPAPGADPRYSMTLIFDEAAQKTDEYKDLRAAVLEAARAKWGDKADGMIRNGSIRMPIRDADEKNYAGYEEGCKFVNFWSKQAPGIVDGKLNDVLDREYVYPGALGRVTYKPFAYDTSGNRGVSLGLQNVQVTDVSTPRLDGRTAAKDDFGATASGEPEMAGADDDMPF